MIIYQLIKYILNNINDIYIKIIGNHYYFNNDIKNNSSSFFLFALLNSSDLKFINFFFFTYINKI